MTTHSADIIMNVLGITMRWVACVFAVISRGMIAVETDKVEESLRSLGITSREKVLVATLISRYDVVGRVGRPVRKTSDALLVKFGINLVQVVDVDEKSQRLVTQVWYEYKWKDFILTWDPSLYDNITSLSLDSKQIWLPDVKLVTTIDHRSDSDLYPLAVVQHTGDVLWMPREVVKSDCPVKAAYFPYDEQSCSMAYLSWTFTTEKLDIHFVGEAEFNMDSYVPCSSWDVTDNKAHRYLQVYNYSSQINFTYLEFKIRLKRRSGFYTLTLVFPCILLSLLSVVVLWVPLDSAADKITLGLSQTLAFLLLLLLLNDSLPNSASSMPLIGSYICLSMGSITFCTALSCVTSNMYYRGIKTNTPPRWLTKLTDMMPLLKPDTTDAKISKHIKNEFGNTVLPGIDGELEEEPQLSFSLKDPNLSYSRLLESKFQHKTLGTVGMELLIEISGIHNLLRQVTDKLEEESNVKDAEREWRRVAVVADRLVFLVFILINVVGVVVLFTCN